MDAFLKGSDGPESEEVARVLADFFNQLLFSRSTRGIFVTMTYVVLDSSSGKLKYSSRGHFPEMLRRGGTGIVEVADENSGVPPGISLHPSLGEGILKLEPEDQLLLVSDGAVEGLCGCHDNFNLDGLNEFFRHRGLHHNRVVDAEFEEIARVSSAGIQQDDMTVFPLG